MGNQLAASGSAAAFRIEDISNSLALVAPLGGQKRGRLFTSLHCRTRPERREVVVKVLVRAENDKRQSDLLNKYGDRIVAMERSMRAFHKENPDVPINTLFYTMASRTQQYVMLQRPHVHYSLLERLQSRPFWTQEQRLFAAFQLLEGVRQLHDDYKATHGDIKAENVLVSTAGWVYLTDHSPFKPAVIPSFNPANFQYFFDSAENRVCCLAPERFADESEYAAAVENSEHTQSMDVFSAVCVIVHIVTDEPLFRLNDALGFRARPESERRAWLRLWLMERKVSSAVVDMVVDILGCEPSVRPTAAQVLQKYTGTVFRRYFGMLHRNVIPSLLSLPPDVQIQFLWSRWDDILKAAAECENDGKFSAVMAGRTPTEEDTICPSAESGSPSDQSPMSSPRSRGGNLWAKMKGKVKNQVTINLAAAATTSLLLPIIFSATRHLKTADARCKALLLLKRANSTATATSRREHLLPLITFALRDPSYARNPLVRATGLKALLVVCEGLKSEDMHASECLMYDDLVLPVLSEVSQDNRPLVKAEFGRVAGRLLLLAVQYLQHRQVLIESSNWLNSFDFQLHGIVDRGWELIRPLFNADHSHVVAAVLGSVPSLTTVLGQERTSDELIPMLMTLLGSQNVEARRLLMEQLPLVAPQMQHDMVVVYASEGLNGDDPEGVCVTLRGIEQLCKGLKDGAANNVAHDSLTSLVQAAVALIATQDVWINRAAMGLLATAQQVFDPVDVLVRLEAPLRTMLTHSIPLRNLVLHPSTVKPEAIHHSSRAKNQPCNDFVDRGAPTRVINIEPRLPVRHAGDIACDTSFVDVPDPDPTAASRRTPEFQAALKSHRAWRMGEFHPLPRQEKRMKRRFTWDSTAAAAVAERRGRARTNTLSGNNRRSMINNRASVGTSGASSGSAPATNGAVFVAPGPGGAAVVTSGSPTASPPRQTSNFVADADMGTRQQVMQPIGTALAISNAHTGPVYGMGAHQGWLVTGGHGNVVHMWDVEDTVQRNNGTLQPSVTVRDPLRKDSTILFTQFAHHDANTSWVATGGTDGVFTVLDMETVSPVLQLPLDDGSAGALSCCVPLGKSPIMLVGTHRGGLYGIDFRAPKTVWSTTLPRKAGPITSAVAFRNREVSDAFAVAASTMRGTVALFDLRFRVQLEDFTLGNGGPISSICRGPIGNPSVVCATANNELLHVDLTNRDEKLTMVGATPNATRVVHAIPQTSLVAAGGSDRSIRVWDLEKPEQSRVLVPQPHKAPGFNFNAGARTVVEADPIATATTPSAAPRFAVHPDGLTALNTVSVRQQQYLISASRDGTVKVWHNALSSQAAPSGKGAN